MNRRHALALLMKVSRHASFITYGSACRPWSFRRPQAKSSQAKRGSKEGRKKAKGREASGGESAN